MGAQKPTRKPSELLREARAKAFDGVSHPSAFPVLDSKGRALRVQPARPTSDQIALQAIANLCAVAADMPRDVAELLDDQSDEDTAPVSPQDRVRETIGALKVRARRASMGRRRGMSGINDAIVNRIDRTDQLANWRTARLTPNYLASICRHLKAFGFRPVPTVDALHRMLNRARRKPA